MMRWLLPLIGLALIAGCVWFFRPQQQAPRLATVHRQPLPTVLREHAMLVSAISTPAMTMIEGNIISIVDSGTPVQAGMLLVEQDTADLVGQIEEQRSSREEKVAALGQHRLELALTEQQIINEEAANSADLAFQEFRAALKTAGPDATDSRLMAIEHELARLDLVEAEEELVRMQRLVERGLQSVSQFEEVQRSTISRRTALQELEIAQALIAAGPSAIERSELQADLDRARGRVARAKQARQRRIDQIKQDIAIQEAEIRRSDADLANREEDLQKAKVFAACDGIAMRRSYRDRRSGGRMVEWGPGARRWPGDVLVDIVDPSRLQAVLMINEVDYPRLRNGLAVEVELAAYPGQRFPGHIGFLAGIGRDRGDIDLNTQERPNTGVSVFTATVEFSATVELRPGMSATVTIPLDELPPALVIPADFARPLGAAEDGAYTVWPEGGNDPLTIRAAPFGGHGLRVIAGLGEGDRLRHPEDVLSEPSGARP